MLELRAATASCHKRLEKRLRIKQRFTHPQAYRAYLERMFGFCVPLEDRCTWTGIAAALPDHDERRKSALLRRDLAALGLPEASIATLPRCAGMPDDHDVAAMLGSLYVIEGATLGGQTLLPFVNRHLGLTAESGASYLASYGRDVTAMWQRFGAAVEAWCVDRSRREAARMAAIRTFETLEDWLCEGSP